MNSLENTEDVEISLIICTYNRADSLRRTLSSLTDVILPLRVRFEILVVDNNSKDHTRSTVESFSQSLPLRYLHERRQGLSFARNTGVRESRGRYIIFTDDDVIPDRSWIVELWTNMLTHQCDAGGGFIAPAWQSPPESWLTPLFYGMLAVKVDENGPYRVEGRNKYLYGANMAFRRTVFDKVGLFDTDLGRKGTMLAGGEDYNLLDRILENGGTIMYFPSAKVTHCIESYRLKKRYFRRWRYQYFRNQAITEGVPGARRMFGVPYYLLFQLTRAAFRASMGRMVDTEDTAFFKELLVWNNLGAIVGSFRRWKRDNFKGGKGGSNFTS